MQAIIIIYSLDKKSFPSSILDVIAITILFVIFSGVPIITLNIILSTKEQNDIITVLSQVFGFGAILFFIKYINNIKIGFNFKIKSYIPLIIFGIFLLTIFIVFIIPFLFYINSFISPTEELINPFNSLVYIFGGIFIGPIIEEILFRNIILTSLVNNPKYSVKKAIIISAFIFSIIHIVPSQIFSSFILGLFIGFYFYKTNSLFGSILLHASVNLIITICSYLHFKYGNERIYRLSDIYGDYTIFIVSFFFVIMCFSAIRLIKNNFFKLHNKKVT